MRERLNGSGLTEADARHHAAIARRVHFFDPNRVAGPNADSRRTLVARERTENLYYFPTQLDRDQAVAIGVEARHRLRFGHDRRLEGLSRLRLEPEQRVEERTDHDTLEGNPSNNGDRQRQNRPDQSLDQYSGCTKPHQHVEQDSR